MLQRRRSSLLELASLACAEYQHVDVIYRIANCFGNKSGMHYRKKKYIVIKGNIYQQFGCGKVKEIKRLTRELKGILSEIDD